MIKRAYEWYKSQAGIKKWILKFILNWLYWGLIYGLMDLLVLENEERHSIGSFLLKITFMALFWTLIYDTWLSPKFRVRKQSDHNEKAHHE